MPGMAASHEAGRSASPSSSRARSTLTSYSLLMRSLNRSNRPSPTDAIRRVLPAVKTRLMASVGEGRFERFSARMSKLYDVSVERARELLGLADRPASWEAAMPGIGLVHFDGGPAYE